MSFSTDVTIMVRNDDMSLCGALHVDLGTINPLNEASSINGIINTLVQSVVWRGKEPIVEVIITFALNQKELVFTVERGKVDTCSNSGKIYDAIVQSLLELLESNGKTYYHVDFKVNGKSEYTTVYTVAEPDNFEALVKQLTSMPLKEGGVAYSLSWTINGCRTSVSGLTTSDNAHRVSQGLKQFRWHS